MVAFFIVHQWELYVHTLGLNLTRTVIGNDGVAIADCQFPVPNLLQF